jgi:competence protein ComEC
MVKIHFLNVGHGDCTIIEHANGNLTMIDINNGNEVDDSTFNEISSSIVSTSPTRELDCLVSQALGLSRRHQLSCLGYEMGLTNPVQFLKSEYPNRSIFRYIQTHPDLDHMRGLAALKSENIEIVNFWDTYHTKQLDYSQASNDDIAEWEQYQTFRNGKYPTVLRLFRGAAGKFYNEDENGGNGNGLHILSPTLGLVKEFDEENKRNEISYVIEYRYANRRIIFGGDAEQSAWESIYQHKGKSLKCDVLKASHHGRDSGYHQQAVKAMSPRYTVVSVGKKPATDASNKYAQYSSNVYSTRWYGDLTLTILEDGTMNWTAQTLAYANN